MREEERAGCTAFVIRDTTHESFRNTKQALPPHCSHPSTTRFIRIGCLLCSLNEVGFRR